MSVLKSVRIVLAGLTVLALLQISAIQATTKPSRFTIKAQTDMEPGTLVVLSKLLPDDYSQLDSFLTDENGAFEFVGEEDQLSIYYITFKTANPPGVPVIIQNGDKIKLDITSNEKDYNYTVTGGEFNESMHKLHLLYTKYDHEVQAYQKEVEAIGSKWYDRRASGRMCRAGYEKLLTRKIN